jgi:hypothetical protein
LSELSVLTILRLPSPSSTRNALVSVANVNVVDSIADLYVVLTDVLCNMSSTASSLLKSITYDFLIVAGGESFLFTLTSNSVDDIEVSQASTAPNAFEFLYVTPNPFMFVLAKDIKALVAFVAIALVDWVL